MAVWGPPDGSSLSWGQLGWVGSYGRCLPRRLLPLGEQLVPLYPQLLASDSHFTLVSVSAARG